MKRIVADIPDDLHDWAMAWTRENYGSIRHYLAQHFYHKRDEIKMREQSRRTTNKNGKFDTFDHEKYL